MFDDYMYAVGKLKLALSDLERSIIWYWPSVCCARSWDVTTVTRPESLARSRASLAQGVSSGHMGHNRNFTLSFGLTDMEHWTPGTTMNGCEFLVSRQFDWQLTKHCSRLQQNDSTWWWIKDTFQANVSVQHPTCFILIFFKTDFISTSICL